MKYIRVKNWQKFQHYKDRNPPWIKLATDTFQDCEFACLQDASKLLAVCKQSARPETETETETENNTTTTISQILRAKLKNNLINRDNT